MRNGTPFTVEKNTPRAGLELGTVRSAGQRLTFFVFLGRHGSVFQTTHKCPCNSSLDTLFFTFTLNRTMFSGSLKFISGKKIFFAQ